MKLVSDLKQYLILNDFPSVNEAIAQNSNMFKEMQVSRSMTSPLQLKNFVCLNASQIFFYVELTFDDEFRGSKSSRYIMQRFQILPVDCQHFQLPE